MGLGTRHAEKRRDCWKGSPPPIGPNPPLPFHISPMLKLQEVKNNLVPLAPMYAHWGTACVGLVTWAHGCHVVRFVAWYHLTFDKDSDSDEEDNIPGDD